MLLMPGARVVGAAVPPALRGPATPRGVNGQAACAQGRLYSGVPASASYRVQDRLQAAGPRVGPSLGALKYTISAGDRTMSAAERSDSEISSPPRPHRLASQAARLQLLHGNYWIYCRPLHGRPSPAEALSKGQRQRQACRAALLRQMRGPISSGYNTHDTEWLSSRLPTSKEATCPLGLLPFHARRRGR